jgi:hypothetical protein
MLTLKFGTTNWILYSDQPTGRLALVFELMEMNIYELIRGRRNYVAEDRIKSYMYQLMKGVDPPIHAIIITHMYDQSDCTLGNKVACPSKLGLPMQEENIMHGMHHCFTFKLGQGCQYIATI